MQKIIRLDPHLADLIAAGEVVERPASVAKELVENAVDAGAKTVTVEVQNGGMTLLRVRDDGCGMSREDAKTAFLRHATSKLRRKEDLEAIGTLGFRGEALAATAAVSRIDLLTRAEEDPEGTSLRLEAGKITGCEPAGCPVGTNIVVRDLFFNTPARMKFMKRDAVEASAVAGAVQKQALAHPEISFRLIKDGEQQLLTPGDGDLLSAVYAVMGRQAAEEMVSVESSWERISVSGYVSRPTATRGTRAYQHFFVNRRYIRSKTLTAALEEAYRNQIMAGRFPSCVLHITMPLSAVDVNVHPAKTEVKFLNEREIFDAVHYGVLGALNRTPGQVPFRMQDAKSKMQKEAAVDGAPAGYDPAREAGGPYRSAGGGEFAASAPKGDPRFFKAMSAEEYRKAAKPEPRTVTRRDYEQLAGILEQAPKAEPSRALREAIRPTTLNSPVLVPGDEGETQNAKCKVQNAEVAHSVRLPEASRSDPVIPAGTAILRDAKEFGRPTGEPLSDQAPIPLEGLEQVPDFRLVGEAFRTYILAEQGEDLILIDKHAAHERINFERLRAQGAAVVGQTLLQPLTCRLDREEAAALLERRDLLLSLGYDLDSLGEGDLLLRQIPADILPSDAAATLSEIAGHLQAGRLDTPAALREEALHTIACKAAIKAGYVTDPAELRHLVAEVLGREDLKYCPHGRPICVVLSKKQLEKQFKRIT